MLKRFLLWLFLARPKPTVVMSYKGYEILGATIYWDMATIVVCFNDSRIYPPAADRMVFKEFYPEGASWPINPNTGERLPAFGI